MEAPRPPIRSVVVIEDEPQIRRFLRTALEAEDGFHALERARNLLGPGLGSDR